MAVKLFNEATAVGVSPAWRIDPQNVLDHTVTVEYEDNGETTVSALTVVLQGADHTPRTNGVITNPKLAVGTTAEKVANGAFRYEIGGTVYTKAAVAAGNTVPSGYDVTDVGAGLYGAFDMYINAAGTISFQFPATIQTYTTGALAKAAADAMNISPYVAKIGRVMLFNNTGATWDSQTDDLTDGSDITNAVFINERSDWHDIQSITFSADELEAQRAQFKVQNSGWKFVRAYIATLTGDGAVTVRYTPHYRGF